eukprot:GILK01009080.1.p1 GENE.GILK01009080.1~~GILK01009080.1.p1  ORF type:complete len:177 (-),score=26.86 GILK01009080.1:170-652(-)
MAVYKRPIPVACVAVVGKMSNPLFIKSFREDDPLTFHYIVHTSLDVVEERVSAPKKTNVTVAAQQDMYLGLLCPALCAKQDYRVYGYLTNTKVKFILVLEDFEAKDADVRSFFRQLHSVYTDTVSNPFCSTLSPLSSKKFEKDVSQLVDAQCRIFDVYRT